MKSVLCGRGDAVAICRDNFLRHVCIHPGNRDWVLFPASWKNQQGIVISNASVTVTQLSTNRVSSEPKTTSAGIGFTPRSAYRHLQPLKIESPPLSRFRMEGT